MYKMISVITIIIVSNLLGLNHGFEVYWNVPTEVCQNYGIRFNLSSFNIIQNSEDKFYGDRITIIYKPGKFPYFDGATPIWGGIPQKCSMEGHLQHFEEKVKQRVPFNFKGYIVLDFEGYQPIYNISNIIYKKASRSWIRALHPEWSPKEVDYMARNTFNEAAEHLFTSLLEVGKRLRPNANWGYYHYPYCSNSNPGSFNCNMKQVDANKEMSWLFRASDALYPSVYVFDKGWNSKTREKQMFRRILNTLQIRDSEMTHILPYFWFKYHDQVDKFLDAEDVWRIFRLIWLFGLDGSIIWGSTADVNSEIKCLELMNFVDTILGPIVKYWTEISDGVKF